MNEPMRTHMRTEPRPKWHGIAADVILALAFAAVGVSAVAVVWLVSCL